MSHHDRNAAAERLVEVFHSADATVRRVRESAFEMLGMLHDAPASLREVVVGLFREQTPEVVGLLCEALNDSSSSVRIQAIKAMGMIDRPEVVPALVRSLRTDANSEVRATAATTLARIRRTDHPIIPALRSAFHFDDSSSVRRSAEYALRQLLPR